MSQEFHTIQRKILNDLLFSNKLRYSDMKPLDMEGSQFTFHLNKLLDAQLIAKENDCYALTAQGKSLANSFDSDSKTPLRQAKHSVVFCAFRKYEDREQTLLYTRQKNPFYGHQGYPTGKVMYGESIIETAERELTEETGLAGKAHIIGIRHYRVYYPTQNDLVEDKVMYICRIDEPTGTLSSNEEGDFGWIDVDKATNYVTNPLPEFSEIFEMVTSFNGNITFVESNHYPEHF